MRLLFAAICLTSALVAAFADDKKPEPGSARAEQLSKLQSRFDEEMADLVKFQRSYQAAAKTISVLDEVTQDLIRMLNR